MGHRLRETGVRHELHAHAGAAHGFMCEDRPGSHHAAAAAWDQILGAPARLPRRDWARTPEPVPRSVRQGARGREEEGSSVLVRDRNLLVPEHDRKRLRHRGRPLRRTRP
ncbi:dienelactone hydrolase family protein [Streptomyces sp. NPDC015350]|uniref:dienelactone hydrolase family protein n=1 Tax=Streptomyces sp. NPDC015350 TaxID=3364955 RepID=UPI0036F93AC7